MAKKFRPLKTLDKTTTLIQQEISKALDPISSNELIDGNHQSIQVTGNDIDFSVNHNLGTANVGYHPGESDTPVQIYTSPNNSDLDKNPTPNQTTLLRVSSSQALSSQSPANLTIYFYVKGSN